jgi:hypothetical protein
VGAIDRNIQAGSTARVLDAVSEYCTRP